MDYWNHRGMSDWGWFAASVGMVLFWALLIILIVLLVRMLNRGSRLPHIPDDVPPEQTLAERFARGEIDEDEYRRRLTVLRERDPGPARR
jgi:putative membrane protein